MEKRNEIIPAISACVSELHIPVHIGRRLAIIKSVAPSFGLHQRRHSIPLLQNRIPMWYLFIQFFVLYTLRGAATP